MCKTNYPELEKMVHELTDINEDGDIGKCRRIKMLQQICEKLLNEYVIKIGETSIEPMLIEAYYYHSGKFEDTSVHASKNSAAQTYELARDRQKNNFGKLYMHYGTKDGIDIVLSRSDDYYLSFLIKNALVDGEWATQCAISKKVCEKCNNCGECKGCKCKYYDDIVLESVDSKDWEIVFLPRKGIKNNFANEPIAALPINKIKEQDYEFTPGISRTEIIKKYIKENIQEKDEQELKELARGFVAWEKCKRG